MNPVELGQGTFPLSEAATDRFAIMINIGYLPPEEEQKLVNFDFKRVRLEQADVEGADHRAARSRITEQVFLHERLGKYIQRLVAATRPYNPDTDWLTSSPSELVERGVDLGASPRAIICWGRLAKVWALLQRERTEVYPEDIQELAPVRPQPPHLARAARGQPRADDGSGHPGHRRAGADSMRTRDHEEFAPLVNLADITEIELVILKRMREVTMGEHRSRAQGSGFDFIGLRDWQAGDRFSSIDWAQSSLTNFSPLDHPRVRAAEHGDGHGDRRSLAVDALRRRRRADRGGRRPRSIATIGMSAVFFQDPFGLVTFDAGFVHLAALRPRTGKSHVVHCLDAYQYEREPAEGAAQRLDQHVARRVRPAPGDAAGDLRLPVRRCATRSCRSCRCSTPRTTCSSC